MIVDYDNLAGFAEPLLGEYADGGGAAADPHALFFDTVDDGRLAGLDDKRGAVVDGDFDGFFVAERHHRPAGHIAFFFGPARQMIDAAEREHLRTVFGGGDVADMFAINTDGGRLRADMTIRVDLHLNAAIAEDAFRDDRDGIHPVVVARDDERGGL